MSERKVDNDKRSNRPLHPRNIHRSGYDMQLLCRVNPTLEKYLQTTPSGSLSIQFSDPSAVLELNRALLFAYYKIQHWTIPSGYLVPPVPGRADYMHYAADLLSAHSQAEPTSSAEINVLDIGTGSGCIYPIIGASVYGWKFVASDIDEEALRSSAAIVESNVVLSDKVQLRLQTKQEYMLSGVVLDGERYDLVVCNPPFHASEQAAKEATQRKWKNLNHPISSKAHLNFGGRANELIYDGGEVEFVARLVLESKSYGDRIRWFTCLVSRDQNLPVIKRFLQRVTPKTVRVVEMAQGQKKSRFVAWSFME